MRLEVVAAKGVEKRGRLVERGVEPGVVVLPAKERRSPPLIWFTLLVEVIVEAVEEGVLVAVDRQHRKADELIARRRLPALPEAGDAERRPIRALDAPTYRSLLT